MKLGVSLKIDVTKIDKSKLFQGQKGTYLDAQVFIDITPDQYGNNGMITQALSKQDREAGQKGAILGNAKIFWEGESQGVQQPNQQPNQQPQWNGQQDEEDGFADSIPF